MGKKYWIGRQGSAMAMARKASSAETRLIHYEMAGRYSIKAATSASFIFALEVAPAENERATLHLREPIGDFQAPHERPGSIACDLPGER